jgi:hypothetical protein
MALQSSGAISIGDIAGEFGGSTPHSLSEYYGVASGVPSSGAISISNFYGKSNIVFTLSAISPSIYDYSLSTATAGLRVGADGYIYALGSEAPVNSSSSYVQMNTSTDWIIPRSGMSGYYVYATKISGDNLTSGTLNSYLSLASDQTWQLSNSTDGTVKSTVIEIKIWDNNTGSGSALATRQYTLEAENDTND